VPPMRKTHFEQIPLEVIKVVLEENARQEKLRTDQETRKDHQEELEDRHLGNNDGPSVGRKSMSLTFDIFRIDRAGVRWLESAESLDHAKARIRELALSFPGEFILLDHKTGNKVVINADRADEG
jgi:hypothetical protein